MEHGTYPARRKCRSAGRESTDVWTWIAAPWRSHKAKVIREILFKTPIRTRFGQLKCPSTVLDGCTFDVIVCPCVTPTSVNWAPERSECLFCKHEAIEWRIVRFCFFCKVPVRQRYRRINCLHGQLHYI